MIIPYKELAADTLQNILEDIVSRDGTDYGYHEVLINKKVEQVKKLLKTNQAYLCFNDEMDTCNIVSKEECMKMRLI